MGVNTEFFIEGTRTRTGKLLMPKYGMVKMIVEAWQSGACDDVQFVPVSLITNASLKPHRTNANLLAEKKKEDLGALLKTTGVLRSKFGRLHIQFGQVLSLKHYAERQQLPKIPVPKSMESENPRLGFEILDASLMFVPSHPLRYLKCTAEPPWPWYRALKACGTRD